MSYLTGDRSREPGSATRARGRAALRSAAAGLCLVPVVMGVRSAPARPALPVIASLTPRGVYAGGPGFQLVVDGAQFEASAQVRWNGAERPTTFVSASRLTAAISPQDVATASTVQVTVVNPSRVGGTSAPMPLPIVNPTPRIVSLSPPVAPLLGEDFGLLVTGAGFVQGSTVRLNGSARVTTFVSATRLVARIQASDLTTPGTVPITVATPAPGGGLSQPDTLAIRLLTPAVVAITPNVREVGATAFTMRVTGSNFISRSVVRWNGSNRSTTFVGPTQLDAAIPASDVDVGGFADVTVASVVRNVGVQTSAVQRFTIATPRPVLIGAPAPLPVTRFQPVEMTFNGGGFLPQMVVRVNGAARPRTVVSATQVRVQLAAEDVDEAGPIDLRFENPQPTIGAAAASLGVVNPAPVASSLTPQNAFVGGQAFTLTVTGSRFVPGSVVRVSGTPRPTTFVSQTQLRAAIPASDLAQFGDLPITVVTPPPGGGTSGTLSLTRYSAKSSP